MNFKIDENLPAEAAEILRSIGFAADTVADENLSGAKYEAVATSSRSEGRILLTLDLDFANIRAYPPGELTGIIVLRVKRQDKATVLAYVRRLATALSSYVRRLATALTRRNPSGELWILDGNRIRFRQGNGTIRADFPFPIRACFPDRRFGPVSG